jgi:hypothetical protein
VFVYAIYDNKNKTKNWGKESSMRAFRCSKEFSCSRATTLPNLNRKLNINPFFLFCQDALERAAALESDEGLAATHNAMAHQACLNPDS